MAELNRLRVTNIKTGEVQLLWEDQLQIEIDGEAFVSIITPITGAREFLLDSAELERALEELQHD